MTLVLMARVLHMRELFLGLNLDLYDFIKLFILMAPSFLIIVLPIACMLSVFLTFLRMNSDRELVAVKASGISIYQLVLAPGLFSLMCMVLAFFVSLHAISWGMGGFRTLVLQIASTRAKIVVQPGVFNQDIIKGLTLFARQVDPETGKLKHVIFEDSRQESGKSFTIIAPEGEVVTDETRGQLVFHLESGRIYQMDNEKMSILDFNEYTVNMDLGQLLNGFDLGDIKPREMSWDTLKSLAIAPIQDDADVLKAYRRVLVEIQKRLALPFSCLVLGLFALPLAVSFEGVKRQTGVILSLSMFFIYYSIFSLGLSLGESGKLIPEIGLWGANILFLFFACIGIYFAGKERFFSLPQIFTGLIQKIRSRGRSDAL